jgi:quercetin dioxygenase-like cupin family protein
MASIQSLQTLRHPELPGVLISPLGSVGAGEEQEVLVQIEAFGVIPMHCHSVDATMVIVAGSGEVLSEDLGLHLQRVRPGAVVFFERTILHGFRAGQEGLGFISKNGGIVDTDEAAWDIDFSPPS